MSGEEANRLLEVAHVARKRRVKEYKEEVVERASKAEMLLHQTEVKLKSANEQIENQKLENQSLRTNFERLNFVLVKEREAASKVTVWTLVKRWFR